MSLIRPWPEIDAVLDTSIVSALLDTRTSEAVQVAIQESMWEYEHVAIPVIACAEAYYGIEYSPNLQATYDDFNTHFGDFPVIPITASTIKPYLLARQAVPQQKKRLNDTWIAASAMEHGATVLTGDDDFDGFVGRGLRVHKLSTG